MPSSTLIESDLYMPELCTCGFAFGLLISARFVNTYVHSPVVNAEMCTGPEQIGVGK